MNPEGLETQLRAWLGSKVGVSTAWIQGAVPLHPEEEVCVAKAVAPRRAEFSTGRWCARKALGELGMPASPILVGPFRGPVWPPGVTGSITHDGGICAAIVGRRAQYSGLGIDLVEVARAEPIVQAAESVLHAPGEETESSVLRFSAKESAIKAISGQMGRWVDFTEVSVRIDPAFFQASVAGFPWVVTGWWAVLGEFLLTAAVMER